MSRWGPKTNAKYKKYNHDIWINKPKKHYIVTTDQGTFEHDADYLDYKKTIANFKAAGYTNINITCVGYNVSF